MQRVRMASHQSLVHKLGDSQMKVSPKFKIVDYSIRNHLLELEEGCLYQPLISGLPDDISLSCLLRLPVEFGSTGRSVCRRWCSLFGDMGRFFTLRKEMGFIDPWLFVFCFNKFSGKIQWNVFDVVNLSWHKIKGMPWSDKVCPHEFRCVSVPGDGTVFVSGGPNNLVLKFEVRLNCWDVMRKMITPRSCFASGVIDGLVYVAGGNSSDGFELDSGEVMDPKEGLWRPISDMNTSMPCYDSAVLDGKLYVTEGWFWPFYVVPRGQVYDPKTDSWERMAMGLREGWTGSSVVMLGHLFVVSEHERTKLKVYDPRNDVWETVAGSPLPKQLCKPFAVNGYNNKIYVTGKNLEVAIGFIHMNSTDECVNFSVRWQVVEAPPGLSDLTPTSAQFLFA